MDDVMEGGDDQHEATMADIANELGLAKITVSRALSNPSSV